MIAMQGSWLESSSRVLTTIWTVALAVVFFTNLDAYIYLTTGLWYTRPVYWTLVALLISLPLLAKQFDQAMPLLRSPIGLWSIGFLALPALYLALFQHSPAATAVMFQHMHFVVLFWLFILVFSAARREAMIALAACTVGVALLNWLEFFHPLASNVFDCRAVGMYLNPNGAAYALVFGMLAGLHAVPDRAKSWFVTAAGISILPTYSRSGMLIYAVAMLVLLASGVVNWRRLMLPALVGTVATTVLFSLALMNVADRHDCVSHSIGDREKAIFAFRTDRDSAKPSFSRQEHINEGSDKSNLSKQERIKQNSAEPDVSTEVRIVLLRNALSEYGKSWVFGQGLGVTWTWSGGQRTHNIFLEKGIEMGVVGLLLWPAFLFLIMLSSHGQLRKLAWALLSSGLVLGLFSHNLFESRQILIVAALLLVTSADKSTTR